MKIEESLPFGFEDTSFQAAGGINGVQNLADTFYDYVDSLEEASPLRAMHTQSLDDSRDKLGRFLCGWLGGPPRYQDKYGSINIPMAHKNIGITVESAEMWLMCMDKAIDEQPYSSKFSTYLKTQFRIPVKRIIEIQNAG